VRDGEVDELTWLWNGRKFPRGALGGFPNLASWRSTSQFGELVVDRLGTLASRKVGNMLMLGYQIEALDVPYMILPLIFKLE